MQRIIEFKWKWWCCDSDTSLMGSLSIQSYKSTEETKKHIKNCVIKTSPNHHGVSSILFLSSSSSSSFHFLQFYKHFYPNYGRSSFISSNAFCSFLWKSYFFFLLLHHHLRCNMRWDYAIHIKRVLCTNTNIHWSSTADDVPE